MAARTPIPSHEQQQPTATLGTLPSELLLDILELLPVSSQLAARILNRRINSLYAGSLDRALFSSCTIRATSRSLSTLSSLSQHPVLSCYVTTLIHDPVRLGALAIDRFWMRLRSEYRRRAEYRDRPRYAEYQKLFWEQERLLVCEVDILATVLSKLPNLHTIAVHAFPKRGLRVSDFDVGPTPLLDECGLERFLERDSEITLRHNTYALSLLAAAAGRARVRVRNCACSVAVLDDFMWNGVWLDGTERGFGACESVALVLPRRENNIRLGPVLNAVRQGVSRLDLQFVGDSQHAFHYLGGPVKVLTKRPFPALEELRIAGVKVRTRQLVGVLKQCSSLRRLTLENILLEPWPEIWGYVVDEMRERKKAAPDFELKLAGPFYTVDLKSPVMKLSDEDLDLIMAYVNRGQQIYRTFA